MTNFVNTVSGPKEFRGGRKLTRPGHTVIVAIILCGTTVATAAEIDEIIVTAQKREQALQDVSTSITAFAETELEAFDFYDNTDLARFVPNLTFTETLNPQFFLRAVGNRDVNAPAQSKIGVYQDQVYQGLLVVQNLQFFDLERIEVLRGPQGTLYGKNTTGGALNVTSRQPSRDRSGYLQMDIGNFDYLKLEGAASFPIGERFSARIAGVNNSRDGWATNTVDGRDLNDRDDYAVRAMLRFEGDRLDALLRLTRGRNRATFRHSQPNTDFSPFGGTLGGFVNNFPDETVMATDLDIFQDVDQDGVALIWDYEFAPFTLTSVTSYDTADLRALQDADSSPDSLVDIGWRTNSRQIVQELRIANDADEARFDYLFGFFFVDEQLESGTGADFRVFADALPAFGLPIFDIKQDMEQDAQQYAFFADFDFELTEEWSLTAGLRYTIDEKAFFTVAELTGLNDMPPPSPVFTVPLTTFDDDWSEFTGHLGVEWRPSQDAMLYASISSGFTGGGFNGGAIVDPGEATGFGPEDLVAVEIGAKTDWLNRRLVANVAAFYYDYTDLQVQITTTSPFTNNFIQIIENAADAEIYGSEIEITALPTDYLLLTASLGLLHSEFENFQSIIGDFSGNVLPDAPETHFSSVLHYQRPAPFGAWFVRGEFTYTSNRYSNATEQPFVSTGGGQELINLRAGWVLEDDWEVNLWVKNVTDNQYVDRALDLNDAFGFITNWFHEPRTYGAQFVFRFD